MNPPSPSEQLVLNLPSSILLSRQRVLLRFLVPILSIGVTMLIHSSLDAPLEEKSRFILYLPAVMLSAWYGGVASGTMAFALAGIASVVLFSARTLPTQQFDEGNRLALFMYFLLGGFTPLLAYTQHNAQRQADAKEQRLNELEAERARLEEQHLDLITSEQRGRADAERESALKTQFVAMVAHELRTPLTSIKGFVSTLLAKDTT